jgi:hypothetical protein
MPVTKWSLWKLSIEVSSQGKIPKKCSHNRNQVRLNSHSLIMRISQTVKAVRLDTVIVMPILRRDLVASEQGRHNQKRYFSSGLTESMTWIHFRQQPQGANAKLVLSCYIFCQESSWQAKPRRSFFFSYYRTPVCKTSNKVCFHVDAPPQLRIV